MMEFQIGCNDAGQRADQFICKLCPQIPRNLLYKAFRKKDIKRNGKWCTAETRLCEGDLLRVYLPDDCLAVKTKAVPRVDLPAPVILYEDDNISILHKPVGLPVHADDHATEDTLIARFLGDLSRRGCYDPNTEQSFTPALCNRLDRNTEGLVIAAKTAAALRCMNEKIRSGEVRKEYLCVTLGAPPKEKDIVTAYHRKEQGNRVRLEPTPFPSAKPTKTGYEIVRKTDTLALVRVRLFTGRTHQIRAQMAALGCPILGDGAYGNAAANREMREHFQLLTAYQLTFDFSETSCVLSYLRGKQFAITPKFCWKYFPL